MKSVRYAGSRLNLMFSAEVMARANIRPFRINEERCADVTYNLIPMNTMPH